MLRIRVFVLVIAVAVVVASAAAYLYRRPVPAEPARPPAGAPTAARTQPNAGTSPAASRPATAARPTARAASAAPSAPLTRPPAPAPEATPALGSLRIETEVPGASVFIDRVGVGTTPITIPNLSIGAHRLDVRAPGYEGFGDSIDVEPGPRTLTIPLKRITLDARADVVHKHGIGSCKGRLIATPAGVRFEATDGKDSFTVALVDITTFDVEINNLRVKTRQGRTFNFADTAADAASLYRFHQAVEEARQRTATP